MLPVLVARVNLVVSQAKPKGRAGLLLDVYRGSCHHCRKSPEVFLVSPSFIVHLRRCQLPTYDLLIGSGVSAARLWLDVTFRFWVDSCFGFFCLHLQQFLAGVTFLLVLAFSIVHFLLCLITYIPHPYKKLHLNIFNLLTYKNT